jgi:predicted nucleotidyltransferase
MSTSQITPYPDVNNVLDFLAQKISASLGKNLVGLYLFGSLTYGDFNPDRSDIDLIAILTETASPTEIDELRAIFESLKARFPKWANRVEVSYTLVEMFANIEPPGKRPYFGDGRFWSDALYGYEWIINNYLIFKYGIPLIGPDVNTLFKEPTSEQVKEASSQIFYKELEPILRNKDWIDDSHYQSYTVLNLCRILYTVLNSDARSKKVAASWVSSNFPKWSKLIQAADEWKYGDEFEHLEEVLSFIRFAGQQIEKPIVSNKTTPKKSRRSQDRPI